MIAPLLSVLIVTGGHDPIPALEATLLRNHRSDVEWLIVDNNLPSLSHPSEIGGEAIRWISAPPGDGHAAFNRGAAAALGSLVMPLLVGDELLPGALSRMVNEWQRLPVASLARYSGITAFVDAPGTARGNPKLPFTSRDMEPDQLVYEQRWQGEPLFLIRIELLRARPIPSPGDPSPPLAMIWRTAGRGFTTRVLNAELASRTIPIERGAQGARLEGHSALAFDLGWFRKRPRLILNAARTYRRASSAAGISRRNQLRALPSTEAKLLWFTSLLRIPGRARVKPTPIPGSLPATPPVILLSRSLTDSKAERQLVELASGLHANNHEVLVVALEGGPRERVLRDAGVQIRIVADRNPIKRGRAFLSAITSSPRPVVYSFFPTTNLLSLMLRRFHRGRTVWHIEPADATAGRLRRIEFRIVRRFARFVPVLIASGAAAREQAIEAGYPADAIAVIPNRIDLDRFRHDPEGRERLRTVWRVPEGSLLIGQVARITSENDYPTFLHAAAKVTNMRPEARFVCIGGGPNRLVAEMHRLSEELGLRDRVIWAGPVQSSASLYSAIDMLASTSLIRAGLSESVAEAMACGTPAIATELGDASAIIGDDRYIVPPANADALAAAILELMGELENDLVDSGVLRARIEREFSPARLLNRAEQVLFGPV